MLFKKEMYTEAPFVGIYPFMYFLQGKYLPCGVQAGLELTVKPGLVLNLG